MASSCGVDDNAAPSDPSGAPGTLPPPADTASPEPEERDEAARAARVEPTPPPALDVGAHHVTLDPAPVAVELVTTTTSAVDVGFRPGDPSMYVVEQSGRVVRVAPDGTQRVVVDLTDRLEGHRDEQGLTGLEFAADGRTVWLHHTDAAGRTRVSEVSVDREGTFDLSTERTLLDIGGPGADHHNAGDLQLAPDGTLLIALGDGEPPGPPGTQENGNDPSTLRGAILRVRPTPDGVAPSEIPDDNPFASGVLGAGGADGADGGGGEPDTPVGRPEVLAWGLRNPWKIDLDPRNGALWVTDVGEDLREEINVVVGDEELVPGWAADFGWSRYEGDVVRTDAAAVWAEPVEPIHDYAHEGIRCAVSGGVVYRGDDLTGLWSGFVFGDFCEGSVSVFDPTTGAVHPLIGAGADTAPVPGVSAIRRAPDGELLVLSWFGDVWRIVPA